MSIEHISLVVTGHVDAGKSTTTGRFIFELGGIDERVMQKLRDEAMKLNKSSFEYAFHMDTGKEERARGVTIQATTKEFFTPTKHYSVIDAPGHRNFIKNMITGASQADVALLMVPADGNFVTSIARGNAKQGQIQGQTRQHALIINLLGIKQLVVGINKMDAVPDANYSESRYEEIKAEVTSMLLRVGWTKPFVSQSVAFLPISGYKGDNLLKISANMGWWKGCDVKRADGTAVHCDTLLDVLDKFVVVPQRNSSAPFRVPISSLHKIRGIGDVLTGCVEQGTVKPGDEVVFLPTRGSVSCEGKVFNIEMHHKSMKEAGPGDNCGFNIRGLKKEFMPRNGDVMVLKQDPTLGVCKRFTVQVRVLDHPGELKVGYCPIAFVRTGRSAVKMVKIDWKIGRETGGQKLEDPACLRANEMGQVVFEPQSAFVVDLFSRCEGLGRVAIMEGASVVMIGKVIGVSGE